MSNTKLYSLLLIFSCFFIGFQVNAQNTVSGTITDIETGESLIGVNILVKGTVQGTITDLDGNFTMNVSSELPYQLAISLVGYEGQDIEISEPNATINIQMGVASIVADEVVVSASRVQENILQSPVTIEKLDLIAIKQAGSADYYDEISKIKGVQSTSASLTFNSINARGFSGHGNTRFVQLQDGMDNAAPLLNFPSGNIVGISELDIKNVELIPGAASALYGPNAFNGILLMTSKDPFNYQGLSAQIKTGITDGINSDPLYGFSVRYAKAFNDKFAFKFNVSTFFAKDWDANDYSTHRSGEVFGQRTSADPDFDGLNLYGDEALIPVAGGIRRTGWAEEDLLESRDAESFKYDAAVHYRITDNLEANVSYKWGQGSSVYQGSERYALRDFIQQFAKVELNSSNWNIRAYGSFTDDGDSYNLTALGAFINEGIFPSLTESTFNLAPGVDIPIPGGWAVAANLAFGGAFAVAGIPGNDASAAKAFADAGGTSILPDAAIQAIAGPLGQSLFGSAVPGLPPEVYAAMGLQLLQGTAGNARPEVGSPEFNALLTTIRDELLFQNGGAGFIDDSNMYHIEGNYDFTSALGGNIGLQVGGNFRKYDLFTMGTIFNEDPDGDGEFDRIRINEWGAYLQASKNIGHHFKVQGSLRYDKNENFDGQVSPRISLVYSLDHDKRHNVRASYQTGFRNPTTQGQYIYFPTTNILLGGTQENAERYGIYEGGAWSQTSWINFTQSGNEADLVEQYLEYVQPEKLQVFEVGYKGISSNKLFLDMNAYYNIYSDFITQNIVYNKAPTEHQGNLIPAGTAWNPYFNAPVDVTSYGIGIGLEYILTGNWKFTGNYAFDNFSLDEEELPSGFENYRPGFNTAKHKGNFGIHNRKFARNFSAGVSMRYQGEFEWFGSFGQGTIEDFYSLDAVVGYRIPSAKTIVKLGVNNITKNEYRTNYGAPYVGRLVHLTITYDQFSN